VRLATRLSTFSIACSAIAPSRVVAAPCCGGSPTCLVLTTRSRGTPAPWLVLTTLSLGAPTPWLVLTTLSLGAQLEPQPK
jgi:hypothetical protein